jgi:plastocyanin
MDERGQSTRVARPLSAGRNRILLALAALGLAGSVLTLATVAGAQSTSVPAVGLAADAAAQHGTHGHDAPAAAGSSDSGTESSSPKTVNVAIKDYAYDPAQLTVNVGDTVVWTNEDSAPHTVTVSDGPEKFNSPNLNKGDSFSYTFTKPGTYNYYCAVHPDMKAAVTAQGSSAPPSPTSSASPSPGPTSSHTMPPPSSSGGSDGCASKEMLTQLYQHLESAHLEESPGQQVADALNLDQWVKTHTVWLDHMIVQPAQGGPTTLSAVLEPFILHIESAHLGEGLGQQVQDALNLDQYIKVHTVLIENMLKPLFAQTTC